jgi:hypothetical protein
MKTTKKQIIRFIIIAVILIVVTLIIINVGEIAKGFQDAKNLR